MQYQVNISIDPHSLQQLLATGQMIAVVKKVTSNPAAPSAPSVIWTAVHPLVTTTVAWTDSYTLFATSTQIVVGANISVAAESGVVSTGSTHAFNAAGQFVDAGSGAASAIALVNQSAHVSNFGLAQAAVVNGRSQMGPTNVIGIHQNVQAAFVPTEMVLLFVSQTARAGQVVAHLPPNALTVELSSAKPQVHVVFDGGRGGFRAQRGAMLIPSRLELR